MTRILVVDDEPKLGKVVAQMLELDGHEVERAAGGRDALVRLAASRFDVVVTDLRMPDVDGLAVLRAARAVPQPPEVVVMTAYATAESAVEAMKAGAVDYVTKPFSMDELRLRVRRLAAQRGAEVREARLVARLTPELVAESPAMRAALQAARQVAATDATVLLLGESGTGKSQLARFIHYQGRRAAGPLVEVHCAALPETLLEGELFGHEKGAFTGATQRKAGHLAAADRGTLFLDEIGEITPATQVKLLRFLQDRRFVPLGATEERSVDVRVVSATNRDLAAAVAEGTFREDFYYRLNVFAIPVPPLRERPEDVLPLAERFLAARGLPPSKLGASARERLLAHRWPGNVRELENALERALILAGEEEIRADQLASGGAQRGRRATDLLVEGFSLDAFERELLHAALERAGGNKTHAARMLGITRRRLYSLLASHEGGGDLAPDDA
ncbi:sigma-54 dependent transcriptional regulator [Anaeromyxobacter sp. Fw109-5]|uniref:sigma-54-dependent transcriptional regulator n=1 Tax=Anaeromyxobacter sp. (strain Fw109-5) TaxID=404589 RepID=UPI0000ED733F|nr:sigma-54 dependent transcriptional regulator [Anaeromyxobacter sp. Fw109-5]ABS26581.1 two component, sigma54 specific, transcriptional regulator, Fis family [Anaeromyxobacter sp. Fw109-5]